MQHVNKQVWGSKVIMDTMVIWRCMGEVRLSYSWASLPENFETTSTLALGCTGGPDPFTTPSLLSLMVIFSTCQDQQVTTAVGL